MIISMAGTKLDMTAIADQFNISTPISLTLDEMTISDSFINTVLITLAVIAGGVVLAIGGKKLLKGR